MYHSMTFRYPKLVLPYKFRAYELALGMLLYLFFETKVKTVKIMVVEKQGERFYLPLFVKDKYFLSLCFQSKDRLTPLLRFIVLLETSVTR